jgi:high-affinity nickel-transport protein
MVIGAAGSAAVALALGLRHGVDADHLAAIDGLTRCNAAARRSFAPYCGALFSAGHGGVILAAACGIAVLARQWSPPAWLVPAGAISSAAILLLLGLYNLYLVFGARAGRPVQPTGLRSGALAPLLAVSRAWQVALVGALFALSFDALALAALFAASTAGGALAAAGLGLAFSSGMVLVDAGNGLWVARLVARSDGMSARASRVMTLTVALVSLAVGAAMALAAASASLERWLGGHELVISGLVMVCVLAGYGAARLEPLVWRASPRARGAIT